METDLSQPEMCLNCGQWLSECRCSKVKTSASNGSQQRPEVACSEWVEELAQKWERRLSELNDSVALGSYKSRHARNELQTCIKELRACAESSSTVRMSDRRD